MNRYLLFYTLEYGAMFLAITVGLGQLLWAAHQPLKKLPEVWRAGLLVSAGVCVAASIGWRFLPGTIIVRGQQEQYVMLLVVGVIVIAALSVYMRWGITR